MQCSERSFTAQAQQACEMRGPAERERRSPELDHVLCHPLFHSHRPSVRSCLHPRSVADSGAMAAPPAQPVLAPGLARKVKKVGRWAGWIVACALVRAPRPLPGALLTHDRCRSVMRHCSYTQQCLLSCRPGRRHRRRSSCLIQHSLPPLTPAPQIMETRTEAPEVVGSLATLSGFYTDNSPAARRRLRSSIENQGVVVNRDFLTAAQSVLQVGAGRKGSLVRTWLCSDVGAHQAVCKCRFVWHRSMGARSMLCSTAVQPTAGRHAHGCAASICTDLPPLHPPPVCRRWIRCRATWMPSRPAARP